MPPKRGLPDLLQGRGERLFVPVAEGVAGIVTVHRPVIAPRLLPRNQIVSDMNLHGPDRRRIFWLGRRLAESSRRSCQNAAESHDESQVLEHVSPQRTTLSNCWLTVQFTCCV